MVDRKVHAESSQSASFERRTFIVAVDLEPGAIDIPATAGRRARLEAFREGYETAKIRARAIIEKLPSAHVIDFDIRPNIVVEAPQDEWIEVMDEFESEAKVRVLPNDQHFLVQA